jgi:gluconolactonase
MTHAADLRPARIFATGLDHPEGVAIAPDGTIWTGGEAGQVYVIDPSTAVVEQLAEIGGASLGMAFDRDGNCLVCTIDGRVVRVAPDGRWTVFADQVEGRPLRTPNAPVFGPDGELYVSGSGPWPPASGEIYRFEPDGAASLHHRGPFAYANGVAIDAANEFLYIVQTLAHNVVRIRLADGPDATVEDYVPLGALAYMPDGIVFDALGNLYATSFAGDGVHRIDPARAVRLIAHDPLAATLNRVTNGAFGGPGFDQLFVANLGARYLSVIDIGIPGQALYGGPQPSLPAA